MTSASPIASTLASARQAVRPAADGSLSAVVRLAAHSCVLVRCKPAGPRSPAREGVSPGGAGGPQAAAWPAAREARLEEVKKLSTRTALGVAVVGPLRPVAWGYGL